MKTMPWRWLRGLALLVPLIARSQAAGLDNMVAFDGVYIPALALTTAAQQDAAIAGRARAALRRLEVEWPQLRDRLAQDLGGASARRTIQSVDRHIAAAHQAVDAQAFGAAHEALEAVRLELMNARRQRSIDYFVDRLTEYHEPMEQLALVGSRLAPKELTPAEREALERSFVQARVLWHAIEAHLPQPAVYQLSPARAAQLAQAVADESAALARLSDALRAADDAALLKAAMAVKPPFARAFTAFGHSD